MELTYITVNIPIEHADLVAGAIELGIEGRDDVKEAAYSSVIAVAHNIHIAVNARIAEIESAHKLIVETIGR
jgi:hypothetical protein